MPTMTMPPLTMPRNFPTVARGALPGAVTLSPTMTCAPLTATTRPMVSRVARGGSDGGALAVSCRSNPETGAYGRGPSDAADLTERPSRFG